MHRTSGAVFRILLLVMTVALIGNRAPASDRDRPVSTLTALPIGVTLPVQLSEKLQAGKTRAGTNLVVTTTQRVPVGDHVYLPKGAKLLGRVTQSDAGEKMPGKPPTLAIRFTELRYRGQKIPVMVKARAIANFTDVADTFLPATDPSDRGNPSPANWTTRQVGGDEVYRSGWSGDVCNTVTHKVGFADFNGVYGFPDGATVAGTANLPLAMGAFSTTASGLYGFDENSHLLSTDEVITIVGGGRNLVVRSGDNLLLEVVARL